MTSGTGVLIVGAGHAGTACAVAVREAGYAGPVTLVGEDPDGAYERPPLSKGFLLGTVGDSELNRRGAEELAERDVDFVIGSRAERIARDRNLVVLADGRELPYEHLVVATGSTAFVPRTPGTDLPGVHTLRTHRDALLLRSALAAARNVVVVGGGFIGLEVAAVARERGASVAVVEMRSRLLERATSGPVAQHFRELHASKGVVFHLESTIDRIVAELGAVSGVVTNHGGHLPADVVVIGAGVRPRTELAVASGLAVDDGILVDRSLRTNDPSIFAIGDAARIPMGDGTVRLESVQNALDQARSVGSQIATGRSHEYTATPWFWSEQYEMKLQIAGVAGTIDDTHIQRRPDSNGFSVYCFEAGVLRAVESVNLPADHIRARRLLAARTTTLTELRDVRFDVQRLLRSSG